MVTVRAIFGDLLKIDLPEDFEFIYQLCVFFSIGSPYRYNMH